ncbi:MAG: hypothetical protein R3D51_00130 [Hyphomicrobiaceae bacterium]
MLPTLHDHLLIGYEVDCLNRTITLHTQQPHWESAPNGQTIKFQGVLGYHFKNDAFSNIIMSIETPKVEDFIQCYASEMSAAFKEAGALDNWALSKEAAAIALIDANMIAVVITSTMGLSGWVLAAHVHLAEKDEPHK